MSFGSSIEIEEQQGKALVDAAIAHGVKHFVYTSVDRHGSRSDTDPTCIRHFASKHRIELYLKGRAEAAGTMTWTILRPTGFMENFYPGLMGKLFATVWSHAISSGVPLQLISIEDIGVFGAEAFLKSDSKDYQNKAISLAGDELTFAEACKICKEKTGHVLPSTFGFVAWMVLMVLRDIMVMFRWFGEEQLDADIAECRRLYPEIMGFGEWVGRNTSRGK
jgi:nucleoside-diphosphate-sugar epimerase